MPNQTPVVSQFLTLHDAVQRGNIEAIENCLELGYDINATNETKLTPLLLAICCNIDENKSNEIVKILIEHGADVNTTTEAFSPLTYAVFNEKEELVDILLRSGARIDDDSRILHVAAERGNKTIIQSLLNHQNSTREFIDKVDDNGRTAAYIAASKGHTDCLKLLMKHGASLNTIGDYNVIDMIFEEIPQAAQFLISSLDLCISEKKTFVECYKFKGRDDKQYTADFSVLMPVNHRQMEILSNIITTATDEEKVEILSHPLIELYLHLKWSRMCYFFYLWIFTYILFVLSMSVYVALITHNYENLENLRNLMRYVMISTSLGLQGHAVLQCVLTYRRHLQKYEMWLNLTCTTLALCAAFAQPSTTNWSLKDMPTWVLHVISVTVLFAWTELMLLIGRLPTYGYYALMFSAVLQNVIRVLLTFICLVVGFALSFSIQFYTYEQFADPWRALVKTTVMMMGEFEYADLFADNTPHLSVVSRVIFLLFIILTSIVLMNLMIGLAVSDIQSLQKESHAKKLEKQIDFLNQLEKVITSKQLNSKFIPTFIRRLFRKNQIDSVWEFNTSTQFRRSKKLPNKLIDSLVAIAKSHRSNT